MGWQNATPETILTCLHKYIEYMLKFYARARPPATPHKNHLLTAALAQQKLVACPFSPYAGTRLI